MMMYDLYERKNCPFIVDEPGYNLHQNDRVNYELRWTFGDYIATGYPSITVLRHQLTPCTLSTDLTMDEVFQNTECVSVVKAIITARGGKGPAIITPWFLSNTELMHYVATSTKDLTIDNTLYISGILHKQICHRLTFPHRVILAQNSKGFFARIETHPEATGRPHYKGKPFFPTKSSNKNLCEGPAIVSSIYELPTYGFMHVKMEQWTIPPKEELDQFLRSFGQLFYKRTNKLECGSSIFGKCILITNALDDDILITYREDEGVKWNDLLDGYLEYRDQDAPNYLTITKTTTVGEYLDKE